MELAIVQLKVGEETCFLIGAIGTNEGALVLRRGDKAALYTPSQSFAVSSRTTRRKESMYRFISRQKVASRGAILGEGVAPLKELIVGDSRTGVSSIDRQAQYCSGRYHENGNVKGSSSRVFLPSANTPWLLPLHRR
jgi:hypothetical protein